MDQNKAKTCSITGGILCIAAILITLLTYEGRTYYRNSDYLFIQSIIRIVMYGVLAVALLTNRRDKAPMVCSAIVAVLELAIFMCGFPSASYSYTTTNVFATWRDRMSELAIVPALLRLVAAMCLVLLTALKFSYNSAACKKAAGIFCFLPSVLVIAATLLACILDGPRVIWPGKVAYLDATTGVVDTILLTLCYLLAGLWTAFRVVEPKPKAQSDEAYCNGFLFFLLIFLTCGIWLYVWIYRVTRYLNRVPGEEERNPTYKLLLCMFVPFYYIYWVYQSAKRIDKLAGINRIPSDITPVCLILGFFFGIIPPFVMQGKLNKIAKVPAAVDVRSVVGTVHFCRRCGAKTKPGAVFCNQCGNKL